MESATVFLIKRFATDDGSGIRTTVFLKGCPLRCRWCHNPESQSPEPQILFTKERCMDCGQCRIYAKGQYTCPTNARELVGRPMRTDEVVSLVMRDRIFYEESGGGVTLSGGEPLTQPMFTIELWESLGKKGIHRTLDTSGYADLDLFQSVLSHTDWVLFDIKAASKELHLDCTGTSNEKILQNLSYLDQRTTIPYAIRIPIIFGMNDGEENRMGTIQILERLNRMKSVQLMPYHAWGTGKARKIGISQDSYDPSASDRACKQWLMDLRKRGFTALRNGGEDQ